MKKILLLTLALAMCLWVVAGAANVNSSPSLSNKAPEISRATPVVNPSLLLSSKAPANELNSQKAIKKDWGIAVTPDPNVILQGGDNIASATVIPSLPYTDGGTTAGFTNDYDVTCPYSGGTAPDVVYSYAPASNEAIDISLCNSSYDTKVYVYENNSSTVVGCNDDVCGDGLQSAINNLSLTAGNTYYIVVDGYGTSSGIYSLDVAAAGAPPPSDFQVVAPGSWTGTTCGAVNDCSLRGSEEHIYEITCLNAGTYTFSLCATSVVWDSYLYLGTGACSDNIAYSDDYCGGLSQITTNLVPGTYYLTIEGYGISSCGAYVLDVTYAPPAVVECPPDGIPEGEADCGTDYVDNFNGGCNSTPPVFSSIACGETICGTSGTFTTTLGDTRDTDWYRIELPEGGILNWSAVAEFPVLIFILDAGLDDCLSYSILTSASADPSVIATATATCPPGVYYVFVSPSVFTGWPCPLNYVASLTCDPYIPPTADMFVTVPAELPYTNVNTTCGMGNDFNNTCLGSYDEGEDIIYELTVTSDVALDIVLDPGLDTWTGIALDDAFPLNPATCISVSTSSSAIPHGLYNVALTAGTYYIMIDTWPLPNCIANYTLTIVESVPIVVECPPEGIPEGEADCGDEYTDNYNGGCNSIPPVFSSIACGETVCGTSGTFLLGGAQNRDTDWYRFELAEGGDLVWSATAEFPVLIFIIDAGLDDCASYSILTSATAAAGQTATAILTVNPGIYYVWVGPSVFTGWPCPLDYVASLTCDTGTPIYSINPTSANGNSPAGGSDSELLTVSNIGTRTLNFDITVAQNDVISSVRGNAQPTTNKEDAFVPTKPTSPSAPPSDPNVILQGGDDIASATVIPSLPYNDAGTTAGYLDDYMGSCGYGSAPDVVYSFTPASDIAITASLCGTAINWDSDLYVLASDGVTELACNDEACGNLSQVNNVALTGGQTYYIVIDGWNTGSGAYVLDVVEYIPCVVTCPEPNTPEGEVDCSDGYVDATNGGCNSVPVVFGSITAGETVCGTTGCFNTGGSRDTDWYLMNLTGPSMVTITGEAEVPIIMGVIIPLSSDPCDNTGYIDYYFTAAPCATGSVTIALTDDLPYILFVAPSGFSADYLCGSKYWVSVQASPLWLSTDISTGSVPEGGSLPVTVNMDGTTLANGTYTGTVFFNTNETGATIHEVPVTYVVGAAGGCSYVVGDINNSNTFNGIDVSYGVSYFKGGNVPPYACLCNGTTWYVAGDVNGSCVFNGIDITYMVGYFKGGAAPIPCHFCPPVAAAAVAPITPSLAPRSIQIGNNQ